MLIARLFEAVSQSSLERTFEFLAKTAKLPPYETEYMFHPTRKWRFDVAWVDDRIKMAIELDGGNEMVRWSRKFKRYVAVGRHTKDGDYEKSNAATILGWAILRFTPGMLQKDPLSCMKQIEKLLKERGRQL